MTSLDWIKRMVAVLVAAGGLGGAVTVIVYTASRASADDLAAEVRARAVLEQKHDALDKRSDDDRREVRRRLERLDAKQDRMLELLERRR